MKSPVDPGFFPIETRIKARVFCRSTDLSRSLPVITCYLKYVIDPYKLAEFEEYGRRWIALVTRLGGNHHGYFLPSEGASNVAYAMFSFLSLADYETYRQRMAKDPECQAVFEMEKHNRSIVSYERSFLRPVFE